MSEEITITKEDLVLWLDRPPSNDDLDLCKYLANAVQNRQKYYEENQQLKLTNQALSGCLKIDKEKIDYYVDRSEQLEKVLDEIREYINELDDDTENTIYDIDRNVRDDLLQILDKVKE